MNRVDSRVLLRPAAPHELTALWETAYSRPDWKEFDGPYFPWKAPTLEEFERKSFPRFLEGTGAQIVEVDGDIAGQVVSYWEDEATRWLEVGIALYSSGRWGRGIGRRALAQWVTYQFQTHELERIGLTTWSGNERMMRCALAVGLRLEACMRKCRYYNGVYYDSVSFGVLRDEWFADGLHVSHAEVPTSGRDVAT